MLLQWYLLVLKPIKKSMVNHLALAICPKFFLIQLLLDKLIFNKIVTNCYYYFTKEDMETFGIACQIQLQNKHKHAEGR